MSPLGGIAGGGSLGSGGPKVLRVQKIHLWSPIMRISSHLDKDTLQMVMPGLTNDDCG
jgi:hypothetical protein